MLTQIEAIKKYRLAIRGHAGQHLLIDPNLQRKIVDLLDPRPRERILEIGPGLGALTHEILRRDAKLWAVEKDQAFVRILKEEFRDFLGGKFHLIEGDILEWNFKKIFPSGRIKVTGNLPYYLTAPILFYLFEHYGLISKAVLTMQKEVGRRLAASPGTKDYGRLTLAARFFADVEHAFDIPPTCFTPPPEVDSSVMMLTFHRKTALPRKADRDGFFELVQMAFSQRRKTLLSLLSRDQKIKRDRRQLLALFEKLGFSPTVRGEELLLKDFLNLAQAIKK